MASPSEMADSPDVFLATHRNRAISAYAQCACFLSLQRGDIN
jgi:hypothetical protein